MDKNRIENEYRDSIENYQELIKAWGNVKRVTKKDGSNFSNFKKNFTNAEIRQEYTWCNPDMKVYYRAKKYGYTYDSIQIEDNDTVESIFKKINNRIEMYNGHISKLKTKVSNVNRVYNEVDRTMKELMKFCKDNGFSNYEICSYINDNSSSWG